MVELIIAETEEEAVEDVVDDSVMTEIGSTNLLIPR